MVQMKLPNGVLVTLPQVGESVQVTFRDRPEWGVLAALVIGGHKPEDGEVSLDLFICNPYTFPSKWHRRKVAHEHFAGEVGWRNIPRS